MKNISSSIYNIINLKVYSNTSIDIIINIPPINNIQFTLIWKSNNVVDPNRKPTRYLATDLE